MVVLGITLHTACRAGEKAQHIPHEKHLLYHRDRGISWQDKVTNADVLSRAGLPIFLSRQRRLRWLGHVSGVARGAGGPWPPKLLLNVSFLQ